MLRAGWLFTGLALSGLFQDVNPGQNQSGAQAENPQSLEALQLIVCRKYNLTVLPEAITADHGAYQRLAFVKSMK
jgi:hypothetical protein